MTSLVVGLGRKIKFEAEKIEFFRFKRAPVAFRTSQKPTAEIRESSAFGAKVVITKNGAGVSLGFFVFALNWIVRALSTNLFGGTGIFVGSRHQ